MAATFHQGVFDLATDQLLFEEIVSRRLADELRAIHDDKLLVVRRASSGVAALVMEGEALPHAYRDSGRGFGLGYDEWDHHFHDIAVFVPQLRVARHRLQFRTHGALARTIFGDEHVSLVRLEDELSAVDRALGGRDKVPEHEEYLLHTDRLLSFAARHRLVCRISP